ncbi:MAG: hypothetical protein VYB34_16930 [Planctomycetota bacterium]|nr:hypothetical protein [Planctomycetota bacterium]
MRKRTFIFSAAKDPAGIARMNRMAAADNHREIFNNALLAAIDWLLLYC